MKSINFDDRVLFYDGVCAMCNKLVLFLLKRDKKELIFFMSLHSPQAKTKLAHYGISYSSEAPDTIYYLTKNRVYSHSDAILKVCTDIGYLTILFKIAGIIPLFIRNELYTWIAKNRYTWFGKSQTCSLLTLEERKRILD
ncbi:MAG: thiol-disulfide oxidoreductase DCC family protein [Bacteroidota bacterium]|jgi:predicted DCC family thiol-disulfide oxidoreductase YuxK